MTRLVFCVVVLLACTLLSFPPASADDETCFQHFETDILSGQFVAQHPNGTTENVTDANVTQGDHVTYTFTLSGNGDCDGVPFTLATYRVLSTGEHDLFDQSRASGNSTDGQPFTLVLGPVTVPDCSFEFDLFLGEGPTTRLVAGTSGSLNACEPAPFSCPQPTVRWGPGAEPVQFEWAAVANATSYDLYRADDGQAPALLATILANGTDPLTYVDATVQTGHVYGYTLTAVSGENETTGCTVIPVDLRGATPPTPIPMFPTVGALALAAVGSLGAVLVVRRWRTR